MAIAISAATKDGGVILHGLGGYKARLVNITGDSSYPTNGSALTASDLGLSEIQAIFVAPAAGYTWAYDFTNSKLKSYTGSAETTNATNQSTVTTQALVIGR